MPHKFTRFEKLVGKNSFDNIKNKTVLVIGIGGVGGYVVESLVRSGIGKIIIVDYDTIDITNINRQIIALDSTIGMKKIDAFEKRINDINKECLVIKYDLFINEDNIETIFQEKIDFIVDACDTISTKKSIIKTALKKQIPLISSMGTGNKLDPSKLEIVDIRKTINDPLARIMRKFIKEEKISTKIPVLSSSELPIKTNTREVYSNSYVPASAGLLITSYIINKLIEK